MLVLQANQSEKLGLPDNDTLLTGMTVLNTPYPSRHRHCQPKSCNMMTLILSIPCRHVTPLLQPGVTRISAPHTLIYGAATAVRNVKESDHCYQKQQSNDQRNHMSKVQCPTNRLSQKLAAI